MCQCSPPTPPAAETQLILGVGAAALDEPFHPLSWISSVVANDSNHFFLLVPPFHEQSQGEAFFSTRPVSGCLTTQDLRNHTHIFVFSEITSNEKVETLWSNRPRLVNETASYKEKEG